jgi:hypothetical protein
VIPTGGSTGSRVSLRHIAGVSSGSKVGGPSRTGRMFRQHAKWQGYCPQALKRMSSMGAGAGSGKAPCLVGKDQSMRPSKQAGA